MSSASARSRKIGPVLATGLVAGNMIGSGVFLLPATLATIGSSTVIGWVITLAGALLLAGMFAVLGATRPNPDGLVQWPAQSLHPAAGFVSWAAYWATNWIGNVAVALAAVGYLALLFPVLKTPFASLLMTLTLIWLFTIVCLFGARLVTRISSATLVIGLLPIVAAIVVGFSAFSTTTFMDSWNVTGQPLIATVPPSLLIIFWAFIGLESANFVSAVVENPQRNVPIAALGGVVLAGVVYIAASVAVMGVIPARELQSSTAPFADIVARVLGSGAGVVVAICAILKVCGTLVGFFLVSGECARSGGAAGFLPRFVTESDPEQHPRRGLISLALMMSAVALATVSPTLNAQFNVILNVSVVLVLGCYSLCALAVVVDVRQRPASRMLGVAALAFSVWVIYASGWSVNAPGLLFIALCVPVGWLLSRRAARRSIAATTR